MEEGEGECKKNLVRYVMSASLSSPTRICMLRSTASMIEWGQEDVNECGE